MFSFSLVLTASIDILSQPASQKATETTSLTNMQEVSGQYLKEGHVFPLRLRAQVAS
jgi:hypothetical protein